MPRNEQLGPAALGHPGTLRQPAWLVEQEPKSLAAANVEYTTLYEDDTALDRFNTLVSYAHHFQNVHGIAETDIPVDSVHILTPENMQQVCDLLEVHGTGVYDSVTGISYVRREGSGVGNEIDFYYTLAHEIGHKLLPGLLARDNGSYTLMEGTADRFARDFMGDAFFPHYLSRAHKETQDFLQKVGLPFRNRRSPALYRPDEIYYMDPTGQAPVVATTYLDEIRVVELVHTILGSKKYTELLQAASMPDVRAAQTFITTNLGTEAWALLAQDHKQVPSAEIANQLRVIDWEKQKADAAAFLRGIIPLD